MYELRSCFAVVRFCISPSDFRDGPPRTGRQLRAERLFDQCHEDRPLGAGDVGAEDVAAVDRENARAVDLSRERELGRWSFAQERDDAFRVTPSIKRLIQ
jgi:hypothetical protein